MIYWIIRFKRQFLLSFLILLVGYNYVSSLYQFSNDRKPAKEDLSIMSYNVRMFNEYGWNDDESIPQQITSFIQKKDPDILLIQEHTVDVTRLKEIYPYYFVHRKGKDSEFGSAIFSKYPILERISIDFPHQGNNNAIYTDLLVKEDTLRVFNVHFQSLNIKPDIGALRREDSKKLLGRIGYGFGLQQEQAEMLMEKVNKTPYKSIIAGDFNNTAFSYIYELINPNGRFKDAFLHSGKGFGETFEISIFPLRIDFMLLEKGIEIKNFERFEIELSDHYPILTRFKI